MKPKILKLVYFFITIVYIYILLLVVIKTFTKYFCLTN